MTTMDTAHATWRKFSFSAAEGNCVEVAAWIKGVQAGEFDDLA